MHLNTLLTVLVLGSTVAPSLAVAEDTHGSMPGMATQASMDPVQGRGVITAINADKRQVTLDHEPIAELNWPRMTMGFSIAPEVDLDGLNKGDVVTFTLTPTGKGQQLTTISKQ
ncbi:copper-binding protein [Marinobacter sp. SS21]|uniref:copper-binding protein n=1 Tax=Marinobacter sp. SS21 TaxID=2979460 RepID=UPI00233096B0|nr:copper-binding protein [Marinobacter sp. SS21]MDC0662345.1 copper-binding protein [Marinobacter sp. SS21]